MTAVECPILTEQAQVCAYFQPANPGPVTIGYAAELLLAEVCAENSPTSRYTYEWHARKLVADWGSSRPLASITYFEVQQWVNGMRQTCKPATIRHKLSALSRLFRLATEHTGLVHEPPTRLVRKPKVNNQRERILLDDEEARLRFVMTGREFTVIDFALQTGLRRIEQWRLRPQDVRLFYSDQTDEKGQPILLGMAHIVTSKTGKGRQVPLNPRAASIAQYWRSQGGDYLFPDASKNRFQAGSNFYRHNFRPALKKAGIQGMTWHDLRHTFATRSLQGGARPEHISRALGHANLSMTSRYLHWAPDQLWPAVMAAANRPGYREVSADAPVALAFPGDRGRPEN